MTMTKGEDHHNGNVAKDEDGSWTADCSCGWTEGCKTESDAWTALDEHYVDVELP